MNELDTYLFFDGNCAEAMRFYERTFGGKIEFMMKFDEGPAPCPEGGAGRIMHASLTVGARRLLASDTVPKYPHEGFKGFSVSLGFPTKAEAQRVFDALADGGKVMMPLEKTFWSEAFGMVTDRFGVPWMIGGGEHTKA
ncbi:VOC family protein [Polyangium sp. 15x6]|uniref:VOC family protein n=1 Tax=Polyangium sp. 15x6 TaxID=3042687 RepID=UPI00249B7985|nr:VOC family protein [Polyangium sp. 15x6]MDI3283890.1 VOC family protein [Polyangium sp. 15x6]